PTPAELAHLLDTGDNPRPALTARPRPEQLPLSFAQQRLWFLYQFEGPAPTYNIPIALRLHGDLDPTTLEHALNDVITRHETLRTVFPDHHGTPYQMIVKPAQAHLALPVESLTEEDVVPRLRQLAGHGIALDRQMPLSAWLLRTGPRDAVLMLLLHHIAGDGWSMGPLARDLVTAYTARRDGIAPNWTPLPVQYADYTLWQHELLGDATDPHSLFGRQADYWTNHLRDLPELVTLPTDHPRPPVASHRSSVHEFGFDASVHAELRRLARSHDVTVFMVLHAGLAALLTRLGAGTDIPIGSPVAGRGDENLDNLIGFFVNTLIWRTDTTGDPTFTELLTQVRDTSLAAYANQHIPFEYLVEKLNPHRSTAHHPLTQIMLALQNNADFRFDLPGLSVDSMHPGTNGTAFDMVINVAEKFDADGGPAGLFGFVEYGADLFEPGTIATFMRRYVDLLLRLAERPDARISTPDLLTGDERRLLLQTYGEGTPVDPEATVLDVVAGWDAALPAVAGADGRLSYGELWAESGRVAGWLRSLGVNRGDIVGVVCEPSTAGIAVLLGVWRAGAAFCPVDAEFPAERVRYLVADAGVSLVVAPAGVEVPALDVPIVEAERSVWAQAEPADVAINGADAAYVIYTSGSSGQPKGVVVPHAGLTGLASVLADRGQVTPESRVLRVASPNFDASVL
ncbi:condensation domain-containing protein, partial [Actinoplanes missouriensis]|uniref:condensation domain-containing protein n=1 Tax=Actinoplanes missouriensis TaxID=1866 RepID=UPI0033D55C5B